MLFCMDLTPKQKKVYEYIQSYQEKYGYPPTQQNIQKAFAWSSLGTVYDILKAIEKRGFLSKDRHKAYSLRILKNPAESKLAKPDDLAKQNDLLQLELLGRVAAGKPIEYQVAQEFVNVPASMLKKAGSYFVLQVSGDSMFEEGILDGDLVLVRKQDSAQDQQIVVASINNAATIKRLRLFADHLELHSAHPHYKPIVLKPAEALDFRIEGIYAGLIRLEK